MTTRLLLATILLGGCIDSDIIGRDDSLIPVAIGYVYRCELTIEFGSPPVKQTLYDLHPCLTDVKEDVEVYVQTWIDTVCMPAIDKAALGGGCYGAGCQQEGHNWCWL